MRQKCIWKDIPWPLNRPCPWPQNVTFVPTKTTRSTDWHRRPGKNERARRARWFSIDRDITVQQVRRVYHLINVEGVFRQNDTTIGATEIKRLQNRQHIVDWLARMGERVRINIAECRGGYRNMQQQGVPVPIYQNLTETHSLVKKWQVT